MPQDLPASEQSADSAAARRGFELTGVHVFAMMVAFFTVVAGVNFYMMRAAIATMPGLDARNGYDESQRYNGLIAGADAQVRAGWAASVEISPNMAGSTVLVTLTRNTGTAADDLLVSAVLEHPAARSRDIAIALTPLGGGRYAGALPARSAGVWTLALTARSAGDDAPAFRSRNRMVVKG